MKKSLANALRVLARRLDPLAPVTINVYGVPGRDGLCAARVQKPGI